MRLVVTLAVLSVFVPTIVAPIPKGPFVIHTENLEGMTNKERLNLLEKAADAAANDIPIVEGKKRRATGELGREGPVEKPKQVGS
jgi:hypothetical protein